MTYPGLQPLRAAVTGGTSGPGRALVAELLRRDARVAFVARHADAVQRTADELQGSHGIVGDVSRKDDIYRLALQITGTLGGLDVLVNNASSLGAVPLALLADTSCEDLELALATNLVGPFRLTKALLGSLAASARDERHPIVVNISSDAAVTPYETWDASGRETVSRQDASERKRDC
jgi:NAD(P)-dependent dehydrogenase (short-subunit alcohol dehydrogenase family)